MPTRHMSTRRNPSLSIVTFKSRMRHRLPQTLCEHGACVMDNCLYIAGGQEHYCADGRYTTNRVHVFNPIHSMWSQCSKMHVPRSLFYFGEMDGHLYAVSGYTAPNTDTPTVERYIPVEDEWQMLAPLPVKAHELAGCTHDHKLYVSGGFRGPDTGHIDLVWQYDPLTNEWHPKKPMLTPRSYHAMTCVGDKLVVVGGVRYLGDDKFEDLQDGEIYDMETDQWSSVLKLKTPASCMSHILLDNHLYIFGGHSFKKNNDHNFVQVINLSKYSKLKNRKSSVEVRNSMNRNGSSDKGCLFNVKSLKLGVQDSRLNVSEGSSNDEEEEEECRTFLFEAHRIFYFSVCVMHLTRRFLRQFR